MRAALRVGGAVLAVVVVGGAARAQTTCTPECRPGETCVGGACMVPAPRESAPPAPPPVAEPPVPPPVAEPPAPPPVAEPPAPPPPATVAQQPAADVPHPSTRPAARPAGPQQVVPRVRQGIVFMPFLGLHSFQDSNNSGLDAGLRLGTFLGAFVNNDLSLNGAVTFDVLNPNDRIAPAELDSEMLELTFSPLFHLGSPQVEFIVGPKLGFWNIWSHVSIPDPVTPVSGDGTGQGWTLGGNMGLLVAVSPAVLAGVIFSLEVRDILHSCGTVTGMAEQCKTSGDSSTILGFSLALLL